MMPKRSSLSLTRLFSELNRQYFGDRLPKHNV